MIEEAVRAFLLADPTIAGLIGTRMYPLRRPQHSEVPAITYERVGSVHEADQDGAAGLATPRLQIDCWATRFDTARAVADAVRRRLHGYRGPAGSSVILAAFLDAQRDFDEDAVGLVRVSQDWLITHREEGA